MTTARFLVVLFGLAVLAGCDGLSSSNSGPSISCAEQTQGSSAVGVRCGDNTGPQVPAVPQ